MACCLGFLPTSLVAPSDSLLGAFSSPICLWLGLWTLLHPRACLTRSRSVLSASYVDDPLTCISCLDCSLPNPSLSFTCFWGSSACISHCACAVRTAAMPASHRPTVENSSSVPPVALASFVTPLLRPHPIISGLDYCDNLTVAQLWLLLPSPTVCS